MTARVNSPKQFLIIDSNARSRLLVVATLARNFPHAVITEASAIEEALSALTLAEVDAVVGFFKDVFEARVFVHLVRDEHPRVPIVIMSETDCGKAVLADGATRFLSCEEWLLVGTTLAEVLNESLTAA